MDRRRRCDSRESWRDDGDYRGRQDQRDYRAGGVGRWNDCDRSFERGRRGDCDREWDRDRNRVRDWDGGQDRDDDPSSPTVWIGGLPNDIAEREIERLCSKYGHISDISIKHSISDTFVFVQYGEPRQAKDAIRGLDQAEAFGGQIKAAPANRKGAGKSNGESNYYKGTQPDKGRGKNNMQHHKNGNGWRDQPIRNNQRSRTREPAPLPPSPSANKPAGTRPVRVYLSQLPRDMEDDELQEIAGEFGKILQYELHREGAYKCGWVEYASKAEAEAAVGDLDERRMDEWNMRLQAYMYPGGDP